MIKWFSKYFKEYFIFTRSEIRGTVVLLIIIGVIILLRWLLPLYTGKYFNTVNDVEFVKADSIIKERDKLKPMIENDSAATGQKPVAGNENGAAKNSDANKSFYKKDSSYNKPISKPVLSPFDPNTASYDDLIKLGFPPKVANILIHFRNAGAHFYKPHDIMKVYGMTDDFYKKIEPFIRIKQ